MGLKVNFENKNSTVKLISCFGKAGVLRNMFRIIIHKRRRFVTNSLILIDYSIHVVPSSAPNYFCRIMKPCGKSNGICPNLPVTLIIAHREIIINNNNEYTWWRKLKIHKTNIIYIYYGLVVYLIISYLNSSLMVL